MSTASKRIAVLVSGGGTNLQALIDAEKRGELGCGKISLVIASKPDVYALERAKNNGIDSMVLARKAYDSIADYSKALADALEAAHTDLVVLDIMMPRMDGFAVARAVRASRCATPILMLTARGGIDDRIQGLNAGADYYLTKPFDTRELLACVGALLRRQGNQVDELTFGNTSLDLGSGQLLCGEKSVRLSAREFDVMRLLMHSGERILSKEIILARVWGYESNAVENHVEVYVGFLRKKLRSIGSDIRIEAIRRLGYHLEVEKS